jgi:hypothetical protein
MSEEEQKNSAKEPLSDYGEPANFKQVWKMFQETDKLFDKTREEWDKTREEWDKSREELDKSRKEWEEIRKLSKETERKIDKLAKLYGGVSENSRDVAEEFFMRGLENNSSLFGISYEQVGKLQKKTRKLQGEYDIVLYNGDAIIVIEVKYKLHPDDVKDFVNRKLVNFKPLFPEYKDKKIIGGVAGMSVPTQSYNEAAQHGLLVLTQSGDNIAVLNPKDSHLNVF